MRNAMAPIASLLVACSAHAQFSGDVPPLQGEHVVRSALPPGFEVLRKLLRQGQATPAGECVFQSEMRLKRGDTSLEEIELEYDPKTCRLIVVQGHTRTASAPTVPRPANKASGQRSSAEAAVLSD